MSSTQQAVRKVLLLIAYTEEETGARKWSDLLKVTRIVRGRHTGQAIEFVAQKSSYLIQQIPSLSYSLGVSWPFCSFIYVLKSAFNFHEKKKSHWDELELHWICSSVRREWHLSGIEFPIHEHMLSLHLFRSYSMPFNKVLQLLTIGFIRVFLG